MHGVVEKPCLPWTHELKIMFFLIKMHSQNRIFTNFPMIPFNSIKKLSVLSVFWHLLPKLNLTPLLSSLNIQVSLPFNNGSCALSSFTSLSADHNQLGFLLLHFSLDTCTLINKWIVHFTLTFWLFTVLYVQLYIGGYKQQWGVGDLFEINCRRSWKETICGLLTP